MNLFIFSFFTHPDLQVPNTGSVAEGRVQLPHPVDISHVPHVQTVVTINTAEPLAGRVKGHSNGIWVASAHLGGKKVADGKEIRDFFV